MLRLFNRLSYLRQRKGEVLVVMAATSFDPTVNVYDLRRRVSRRLALPTPLPAR